MFHPHLNNPGPFFHCSIPKPPREPRTCRIVLAPFRPRNWSNWKSSPRLGVNIPNKYLKPPPRTSIWLYCWKIIHWTLILILKNQQFDGEHVRVTKNDGFLEVEGSEPATWPENSRPRSRSRVSPHNHWKFQSQTLLNAKKREIRKDSKQKNTLDLTSFERLFAIPKKKTTNSRQTTNK